MLGILRGVVEALVLDRLARLEATPWLVGRCGGPEFDLPHAVLPQGVVEVVDLAASARPIGLFAEAVDALDQHAAVPAAVEQR
ncbi:MAG TPA: hypothetical protein PLA97_03305 [Rubrivivax sp.]|nr:hypothetical protein [Rubrivivax sp.]